MRPKVGERRSYDRGHRNYIKEQFHWLAAFVVRRCVPECLHDFRLTRRALKRGYIGHSVAGYGAGGALMSSSEQGINSM